MYLACMASFASTPASPIPWPRAGKALGILAAATLGTAAPLWAGGDGNNAPRREFRQSPNYPYTFVPVTYLENGGPHPMRFGPATVDCSQHNPPPLTPEAAGKTDKKEPEAPAPAPPITADDIKPPTVNATSPEPVPVQPAPAPVYPPGPPRVLPDGEIDLNRPPNEVMQFFQDPYFVPPNRGRYIDPIFDPAYNPADNPVHLGPKSRAIYREE